MVITKDELKKISINLVKKFKNNYQEEFLQIDKNIQKIIKNKEVFWPETYNNNEALKNINLNFYKIKNLEDFIFYAYYYILQDPEIRYNVFNKIEDFAKIFDRIFDWGFIENIFEIDMSSIGFSFANIFKRTINVNFTELELIKDKSDLKIKIEKINI